jgi:hypothetical protein
MQENQILGELREVERELREVGMEWARMRPEGFTEKREPETFTWAWEWARMRPEGFSNYRKEWANKLRIALAREYRLEEEKEIYEIESKEREIENKVKSLSESEKNLVNELMKSEFHLSVMKRNKELTEMDLELMENEIKNKSIVSELIQMMWVLSGAKIEVKSRAEKRENQMELRIKELSQREGQLKERKKQMRLRLREIREEIILLRNIRRELTRRELGIDFTHESNTFLLELQQIINSTNEQTENFITEKYNEMKNDQSFSEKRQMIENLQDDSCSDQTISLFWKMVSAYKHHNQDVEKMSFSDLHKSYRDDFIDDTLREFTREKYGNREEVETYLKLRTMLKDLYQEKNNIDMRHGNLAKNIKNEDIKELLNKLGITADVKNQTISNIKVDESIMTLGVARYMTENVDAIKQKLEDNGLYQMINEKCTTLCSNNSIIDRIGNKEFKTFSDAILNLQKDLQSNLLLGLIQNKEENDIKNSINKKLANFIKDHNIDDVGLSDLEVSSHEEEHINQDEEYDIGKTQEMKFNPSDNFVRKTNENFTQAIKESCIPWYKKIALFFGFGENDNGATEETVESLLEKNDNSIQINKDIYDKYQNLYKNQYNFTEEPSCCGNNYFISKIQDNIQESQGRMMAE